MVADLECATLRNMEGRRAVTGVVSVSGHGVRGALGGEGREVLDGVGEMGIEREWEVWE